ncbi:HEPN domain-containing protein [Thiocystis violacea]|uniref:HEPN domain-containing protein n=1 Tax=Thiocystis violacea TaxID=13725 RepID=UPI0019058758|nr:MAE_28990/MAE_18760 family HEPN-like nuclease [Thiocystis violacea]MBK1725090.1 hypothetical protein [Thiocystis violacea]
MRSVLLEMERELGALAQFVSSSEAEESLIAILQSQEGFRTEEVRQRSAVIIEGLTNKKRYVYAVSIVSLYGALERYVEKLVHAYLSVLSNILGYTAIAEGIRRAHLNGSIDYLQALRDERVKSEDTVEEVIKRLAGCIKEDEIFEFNAKAFTLRSGNMNRKRIAEICERVEVKTLLRRIDDTVTISDFEEREEMAKRKSDEEVRGTFKEIDEIVETRNAVSHGALQMDQIEDNELVKEKIEKVGIFGKALYEVLEQEVWKCALEVGKMKRIGVPIHKYGTNVVCFNLETGSVRRGDWMVLVRNKQGEPFRRGIVETLQVNNEEREDVDGGEGVQIGIGLSVKVSKNGEYWIAEKEIVELVSQ